jgi:hypothetical protein
MMRRCIPPIRRWDMGSGVARQCSRNSCLTGWANLEPQIVAPPRPSRSSELEEGPGHGPDPRFVCPTGWRRTSRRRASNPAFYEVTSAGPVPAGGTARSKVSGPAATCVLGSPPAGPGHSRPEREPTGGFHTPAVSLERITGFEPATPTLARLPRPLRLPAAMPRIGL